ncbi:hypothetical protein COCNU_13G003180 [Cocos nucifera]|uniref:Uncharacterized protein n=1 Tax=Cocos nucifera TaxID=13894 RepID=A0A8K0NBC0_COCNU|nr:hypothetical protein COCNU_13G003180 [Cocos nucifera]
MEKLGERKGFGLATVVVSSFLKWVTMAPKYYLAFIPAPRRVTHSSTSKEQSKHTLSTSTLAAQGPPPLKSTPSMASTPPIAESLPSSISEIHATTQAFECASSSRIFHGPTQPRDWHLMDATIRDRVWKEIWRRYDFSDHKRAQDV